MLYFYVYPSAFQNPGGGEILLLKTKEYLEKQGVKVHLFNQWTDRFKESDILHVFGSVKEALGLMEVAKSKGVKIVHSPIIWYNWQSSLKISYKLTDRVLCLLRQLAKTVCPAIPSDRKKMMQLADVVSAGSQAEAEQIHRYFLIPENQIRIVTYGVDSDFESADPRLFEQKYGVRDFVLMVGRIEPRKNQLQLIRAMKGQNCQVVMIGSPVSSHLDYYQRCRSEAASNMHFMGHLDASSVELKSAFRACNVFALPTWFETPGLSALEAGLAGAKIVITREGATHEYFEDYADYVNPASVRDIRDTILKALRREKTSDLKGHIRQHYLWDHTATQQLKVYESLGFKNEERN